MFFYQKTVPFYRFHAIPVDGHDIPALLNAFKEAHSVKDKPVALILKTYKGYDFPEISDKENWHGKPLGAHAAKVIEHLEAKLQKPSTLGALKPQAPKMDCQKLELIGTLKMPSPPPYQKGQKVGHICFYKVLRCSSRWPPVKHMARPLSDWELPTRV